jgi:GNAT superfamily N-acetyltransferase
MAIDRGLEVLVRPAFEADKSGVLNCLATAFEPYRGDYTAQAFADTVIDATGYLERLRKMHVLVADSASQIVGTVAGEYTGPQGHLRGMAVLPGWKGTGLAPRLLLAIEDWLRTQGCTRVTLDTTQPLKAAISFYEKSGYRYSGHTTDFFGMPLLEYVKHL